MGDGQRPVTDLLEENLFLRGSSDTHLQSQRSEEGRDRGMSEFEASLVYKVSSRTTRETCLKQMNKQTNNNNNNKPNQLTKQENA